MAPQVAVTDHRPSLSPASLEDKPAGTRRQQLASKLVEVVRISESATAKTIKFASNAATVTLGNTKVALVPPSAAILPHNGLQRAVACATEAAAQPTREPPGSNAAIVSVGKTRVALVPPSAAAAVAAVQPAAVSLAAGAQPQLIRLCKARPGGAGKPRAARPAVTRALHHNLLNATGAPGKAAPLQSAAAQAAGALGSSAGVVEVDDGLTEEWFESVAETPTPYSLNLGQHRRLQKLFVEHVARMWFNKRSEESDARLRVIIASARCHDMVPEVLARLKIPFLVQVLYQHPNEHVARQSKLLNESDDWKKALALMKKIAMKQLGLTKEQASTIVANMVKEYSLPTTAAAATAPSSKAPIEAKPEGANAGDEKQGGKAGRRGKRGRRSNLQSSPSPVKRPRDAVAQGGGMTLRDRAVQPAIKKPRTVKEMETSQLPAILGLQVAESPAQGDAAVQRLLPQHMAQPDHASHPAQPSRDQATPRAPAVLIAPEAQPQKKRRGRPSKKVQMAAQDPAGADAEIAKRPAPVDGIWDLPSVLPQDGVPELQPQQPASDAAPGPRATAPDGQIERKRARRLVPASEVDAMPEARRPRGRPPRAAAARPLSGRQLHDAAQPSGTNAGALLGLAGGSLPARPPNTSAKSGSGGAARSSSRSLQPVPAATPEEQPSAALAAEEPAVPVPAHEELDTVSAEEDLPDAAVVGEQPTMSPEALGQHPSTAAEEWPPVAVTVDMVPELPPGLDALTDERASESLGLVAAAEEPSAAVGADQPAVPLPSHTAEAEQHMEVSALPQPASAVTSPAGSAELPACAGISSSGGYSQLVHEAIEPTGINGGPSPATDGLTWSPLLLPLPPPNAADGRLPGGAGGISVLLRPATAMQPELLSAPSGTGASDSSRSMSLTPGSSIYTSRSNPFCSAGSAGGQPALPAPGTPLSRLRSSSAAPPTTCIPMADLLPTPVAEPPQQDSSMGDGGNDFMQQQQQQQQQQQEDEGGGVSEQVLPSHAPSGGLLTELFASQSWWRADGTFKLKTGSSRATQAEDMDTEDTEDPAPRTTSERPESSDLPQLQTEPPPDKQPPSLQLQPQLTEAPRGASPLRQCSSEHATSEPPSHRREAPPLNIRRSRSLPKACGYKRPGAHYI